MAAKKKPAILFGAFKLTPEQFIMPDDGRKRSFNGARRRQLFTEMASFAKADGSGACMSAATLGKKIGCHRRTIYRLQGDLMTMGWIKNCGNAREFKNTIIWALTLTPTLPPVMTDSPISDDRFAPPVMTDSTSSDDRFDKSVMADSHKTPSNLSHNLPLKISAKDNLLKISAKNTCLPTDLNGGKAGRLQSNKTESEAVPDGQEWRKDFQLLVQRIATDKGVVFTVPLPAHVFEFIETLGQEITLKRAQQSVEDWLESRSLVGLENPNVIWSMMPAEIAGIVAEQRSYHESNLRKAARAVPVPTVSAA